MSQFDNKVTIEVTKDKKIIQLSGDYEFIELFLPKVMGNCEDLEVSNYENLVKAFNEKKGYLSETVEIERDDKK